MNAEDVSNPGGTPPVPTPVVLCVAPNGARRTPADHPALPMTAAQLAKDAAACSAAGATVLHLHVRDEHGGHSLSALHYRRALDAIKDAVGPRMLVQVTTEAVGRYTVDQQLALLEDLRPDAASLAVREIAPAGDLEAARALGTRLQHLQALGIALQYILYNAEEARRLATWVNEGLVPHPTPNVLFVLGRHAAGQRSSPADLLPFLAGWPGWPWSVCAFGPTESQCMAAAIGLGGHARVGFENNLWQANGQPLRDNASSVRNAAALAHAAGRGVASVQEARALYGVPSPAP